MPNEAPATSILELLLHPNPTVSHRLPRTKTNSRRNKWHCPEKVGTWDELSDIRTLHDAFGGRLLEEARRGGRDLPCYPTIHPQADCIIRDEPDTEKMINKWNKEIVNAAVVAISPEFRTAIWCKGDPPLSEDDSELPPKPKPERTQPPRGNLGPRPRKTQSLRGMKSDSGSILLDQSHSDPDFRRTTFSRELFPKEYKPAGKWMSRWIYDYGLIDENGRWARGKRAHNYAWPIKQAYTYCIQHMCRYGCILTCREAFIFRVKPLDKAPVSNSDDSKVLRTELIHNGLMEHISIPWDNHHQGDVSGCTAWTVNLALWFMHVLAATNHEVKWTYDPLVKETLTRSTLVGAQDDSAVSFTNEDGDGSVQTKDTGEKQVDTEESDGNDTQEEIRDETEELSSSSESEDHASMRVSSATKRKRDSGEEEGGNFSFNKRPFLGNQISYI